MSEGKPVGTMGRGIIPEMEYSVLEKSIHFKKWHRNWLVFSDGEYQAYEPDNEMIGSGTLDYACSCLNNSTFGE